MINTLLHWAFHLRHGDQVENVRPIDAVGCHFPEVWERVCDAAEVGSGTVTGWRA